MVEQRKLFKRCYNCGCEFTDENKETVEHIPMKALYTGYSGIYKINRITVPACFSCNNRYAKTDPELRNLIGVLNEDNKAQSEITAKAARGITREKDFMKRLDFSSGELTIEFDRNVLEEIHQKHFKGLFYNRHRIPLPKSFEIKIITAGDEQDKVLMALGKMFHEQLEKANITWTVSGHQDIFQYRLSTLRCDVSEVYRIVNDIPDGSDFIVCEMIYHKKIDAICLAMKSEFIPSVK